MKTRYKEFTIYYEVTESDGKVNHYSSTWVLRYPTFGDELKIKKLIDELRLNGSDMDFSTIIATLKVLAVKKPLDVDLDNCAETYLYILYELYVQYTTWKNSILKFDNVEKLENKIKEYNHDSIFLKYLSSKYNIPITDPRLLEYTDEDAFLILSNDIKSKEGNFGLEKLIDKQNQTDDKYDIDELGITNIDDWDKYLKKIHGNKE